MFNSAALALDNCDPAAISGAVRSRRRRAIGRSVKAVLQTGYLKQERFAALLSLLHSVEKDAELSDKVLGNWHLALALSSIDHSPSFIDLACVEMLFLANADGASPLDGTRFTIPLSTEGTALVPGFGLELSFSSEEAEVTWDCTAHHARVYLSSGVYEVELPLRKEAYSPSPAFSVVKNGGARSAAMPIIDRKFAFHHRFSGIPPSGLAHSKISGTVSDALSFLDVTWPAAAAWVRALVPAIIQVSSPGRSGERLSGSFEPGLPIYLGQAKSPQLHAEDLLHECQHLRFALTVPADSWFSDWSDKTCVWTSPYRLDPRPAQGLHIGLHAFIAVSELRLRARKASQVSLTELADILDTHLRNAFAARSLLAESSFTSDGDRYYANIVDDINRQATAIGSLASDQEINSLISTLTERFWSERASHKTINSGVTYSDMTI